MDMLFMNVPSMIMCYVAAYLAVKGIDGWGWFLFFGILIATVQKLS